MPRARRGGQCGRGESRGDDDCECAHRPDDVAKPLHRRSIAAPSRCWKPGCDCAILVRTVPHLTFRILGPLEALVDGRRVDLSSRRERALLGVLLLRFGEVVSVDALVDSVWGEQAPASARHMVHEYVSRLRGVLGDASVIVTRAPGYTVRHDACDLDAARFAELLRTARSAVARRARRGAEGLRRGARPLARRCARRRRARGGSSLCGSEAGRRTARRPGGARRRGPCTRPPQRAHPRSRARDRRRAARRAGARAADARPLPQRSTGRRACALPRRPADPRRGARDRARRGAASAGAGDSPPRPGVGANSHERDVCGERRRSRGFATAGAAEAYWAGGGGGPSSSSPGWQRLPLSPRERPRTGPRPFGATRSRWSTLHTRALSARCLSPRRRARSPTAPARSGCPFPIPGRSRGSRPDRGGSPPRSRSA